MTQIKRKIHVIGINSFEFKDLPLKFQKLYMVPCWGSNGTRTPTWQGIQSEPSISVK